MSRLLRTIKVRHVFVAFIAIIATSYIFLNTDARAKLRSIFRKRMEALTPSELQHMAQQSRIIAEQQQEP